MTDWVTHDTFAAEMRVEELLDHASPRRLSRDEFQRMGEQGFFRDERVELIAGVVVEMSPVGPPHSDEISVLTRILVLGVGDRAVVRVQLPFAAGDDSQPQPDLALVAPRRWSDRHPDQAFLLVEVAESSLAYDRRVKARVYALSGVPEYWVVDVVGKQVEVFEAPVAGSYTKHRLVPATAQLAPAAFPDVLVDLGELFQ
ncbi:MAG: Uma2 family endonuclease [Myxococcales bacterium]|nr:Uma2 family endonuclease [Myxococcales bacterium]